MIETPDAQKRTLIVIHGLHLSKLGICLPLQIDSDEEDDDSDVAAPEYSNSGNLSVLIVLWLPKYPISYSKESLVEFVDL
jgi:hypothetical protein